MNLVPILSELHEEMNNLFNNSLTARSRQFKEDSYTPFLPPTDIRETDKAYHITTELAGVDPKHIDVSMENGILTIKGEKITESKTEREQFSRVERFSGSFYRRFALPDTADSESIRASFKHGVLTIEIPKSKQATNRKIEVKINE
ncbi:MAG: Hsp20/alpha crystallin family protein [Gammaproteobacteria bacterium]